jgi:hypothetical protein
MDARESRERIILAGKARPGLAFCPNCDEPLRKLYVPPGAPHFLCRRCHGLVYRSRPRPDRLAELQAAMGPLLEGLYADRLVIDEPQSPSQRRQATAELLVSVTQERPLAGEELRVWCLRLGRAGLSCRAIARHTGTSKSSVQRYLAAGTAAVDRAALTIERLERYHEGQMPSLAGLSLRAQAHLLDRHARRLGLQRHTAEPEEKVFL